MISRRALLAGAGVATLVAPSRASAQARGQALPLLGLLTGGGGSHTACLDALRGLGYTEGQTVLIETRFHLGMWRQAAGFVVRVLKGASPAEMPVERPAKFNLLVNLKTAKALKVTVPPLLRERADRIIE